MSYEKKEDLEVLVVPEPEWELVPTEPAPSEPEPTPEPDAQPRNVLACASS